jgi:methionyl-tRNA formyltransferase
MDKKPLRAVLLYSAGHLGSTIVFNLIHNSPEVEIVGVVRSKPIPVNKKGESQWGKKRRKQLGLHFAWLLAWQWIVQHIILAVTYIIPRWRDSALVPCRILAKRKGIPTFNCVNVNTDQVETFIRSIEPDLIISAYFSQIIDPRILALPKIGSVNIHPGYLPQYKGALSYFWVLRNGEREAGVTIHWMNEKLDDGEIIERKKFKVEPNWTQQQVMVETALIAGRLIQKMARKLLNGTPIKTISIRDEKSQYYSMPTEADFKHYFRKRGYFRIRDTLKIAMYGIKHRRKRKHRKIML